LNTPNLVSWSFTCEHITLNRNIFDELLRRTGTRDIFDLCHFLIEEVNRTTARLVNGNNGMLQKLNRIDGNFGDSLSEYDLVGQTAMLLRDDYKVILANHVRFSKKFNWFNSPPNPEFMAESFCIEGS
jgi:hypothetical protein